MRKDGPSILFVSGPHMCREKYPKPCTPSTPDDLSYFSKRLASSSPRCGVLRTRFEQILPLSHGSCGPDGPCPRSFVAPDRFFTVTAHVMRLAPRGCFSPPNTSCAHRRTVRKISKLSPRHRAVLESGNSMAASARQASDRETIPDARDIPSTRCRIALN